MKRFDLGFLGGGQLARMSIQAAQRMGLTCLSLDPGKDTPASQVAEAIQGSLSDVSAVAQLVTACDKITLENEFIPADTVREAFKVAGRDIADLTPGLETLACVQDKLAQREAYARAGVPSPSARAIDGSTAFPSEPVVLKARFGGYDGKGTRYARTAEEFESHRSLFGAGGWLAEDYVAFRREVAVMVYRSESESGCFPTMETIQVDHVCDLVFPADGDASEVALAAVEAVGGFGLFGVELFETDSGSFLVNEIAPRPHNTGHYTLDWGGVSQFEQHVRLAMGLPCVKPEGGPACMANLLGQEGAGDWRNGLRAALSAVPKAHVHWYGKAESRVGRKMGHINVAGEGCVERAKDARAAFYSGWTR